MSCSTTASRTRSSKAAFSSAEVTGRCSKGTPWNSAYRAGVSWLAITSGTSIGRFPIEVWNSRSFKQCVDFEVSTRVRTGRPTSSISASIPKLSIGAASAARTSSRDASVRISTRM